MNLKRLTLTMATLVTVGCGPAVKSAADYNRTVHLPDYHSFFIVKGASSGNAVLDERATTSVEAALMSKGWEEVPAGEGRAAVVVHAATDARHSYEMFYEGWGGWRWRGAAAGAPVAPAYKPGTVVVDIFDAGTQQVIWRGSTSDALGDHQKDNVPAAAVTRMFSRFPPEQWPTLGRPPDANRGDADLEARIYFAQSPALLIVIDGDPVYRPIEGTDLERIVMENLFGDFYCRTNLDPIVRSLCTISVLASQGREVQLKYHIKGALNIGATQDQIIETLKHLLFYAGLPAASTGLKIAKEVFAEVKAGP